MLDEFKLTKIALEEERQFLNAIRISDCYVNMDNTRMNKVLTLLCNADQNMSYGNDKDVLPSV